MFRQNEIIILKGLKQKQTSDASRNPTGREAAT